LGHGSMVAADAGALVSRRDTAGRRNVSWVSRARAGGPGAAQVCGGKSRLDPVWAGVPRVAKMLGCL
jgi:hypothetical protein